MGGKRKKSLEEERKGRKKEKERKKGERGKEERGIERKRKRGKESTMYKAFCCEFSDIYM